MSRLSQAAREVKQALTALPPIEQATIIGEAATALAKQVGEAAPTAGSSKRSKAQAALNQGVAERLISKAGGIFLGEKQLKELGVIGKNVTVPPIPEKFSRAFLNARHPLRDGKMAAHIILGFDPDTKQWYCFEKSIVPGSLGQDGRGLSGPEQDELLLDDNKQPRTVQNLRYTSPTDYRPIKRVLDDVIKLQLRNSVQVRDLPFYGVLGRTADEANAGRGCRVLLGRSHRDGSNVNGRYSADYAYNDVGLLAGWN